MKKEIIRKVGHDYDDGKLPHQTLAQEVAHQVYLKSKKSPHGYFRVTSFSDHKKTAYMY